MLKHIYDTMGVEGIAFFVVLIGLLVYCAVMFFSNAPEEDYELQRPNNEPMTPYILVENPHRESLFKANETAKPSETTTFC